MSTFVLAHGSWYGAWSWQRLTPLSEAAGHQALAPNLPGHGDDRTPTAEITLDGNTARVADAARPRAGQSPFITRPRALADILLAVTD